MISPPVQDSAAAMRHRRSASVAPTTSSSARPSVLYTYAPITSMTRSVCGVERRVRLLLRQRMHREMQFDLAERREDCCGDRDRGSRPLRIKRLERLVRVRLAAAGDPDDPSHHRLAPGALAQRTAGQRLGHRFELAGRAWQQNHQLVVRFDPQPRRGPKRIVNHSRANRHHRLAAVDLRHRQAAALESRLDSGGDRGVLHQRAADHVGHDDAREIVVGRPQAAAADHEIDAGQRVAYGVLELQPIVADDGLEHDVDTQPIQLVCDEQRIRIGSRRRQQLASDGEDRRARQRRHVSRPGRRYTSPRITTLP
jgi:hypothetical protein